MSGWPNISRAQVVRFSLVFGSLCLVVAAVFAVLASIGPDGSANDISWVTLAMFAFLGVLSLIGAWAARRDERREDRDRAATERS